MGTNYYAYHGKPCEHCGEFKRDNRDEWLHIGKSPGGWCFLVHIYPSEGLNNLADWTAKLAGGKYTILDEYGSVVSMENLMNVITDRFWPSWSLNHRDVACPTCEKPGVNNCRRHSCGWEGTSHGEGPYDYFDRDFS